MTKPFDPTTIRNEIPLDGQAKLLEFISQSTGMQFSSDTDLNLSVKAMRDYFEGLMALMPGHVYWLNRDGYYLGCNDNQAKFLKLLSRDDIVGKKNADLLQEPLAKNSAVNFDDVNQHIMSSGIPLTLEEQEVLADGSVATFLSRKIPLKDNNGAVIGLLGVSIDITAQKEAERLKQEKDDAEKRAGYLRAAAGSIAHELRTPLASIAMAAKFINGHFPALLNTYQTALDAQLPIAEIKPLHLHYLESRVDNIIQQTYFANAFIDLILGNLKEDTELNVASYQICDMSDVINSCISRYPLSDSERSLIHWDNSLSFKFLGDEFLMINVLNNLIKNALYFIKDARKGDIYIWVESTPKHNLLYFKDTAKGASPDIISNLFQSFYSRRQGGTGLGLAFCKKIMNSFGGEIDVESQEGEYMQFTLIFPIPSDETLVLGNNDTK